LLAQDAVLGVNHLKPRLTATNLAKTGHMHADTKLFLLLAGKVEETQRHLPAAIANTHQQIAAATKHGFREQYFAADQAACAGLQRADAQQLRSIFVTQRQQKQEVVYSMQIEFLESLGERRSDAP
jgi:hypothetical protein